MSVGLCEKVGPCQHLHLSSLQPSKVGNKIIELAIDTLQREQAGFQRGCIDQEFTILITGDTHSSLEPAKDFISEKPLGGVVRRINYFEQVQKLMSHPVLKVDAGDFLVGTPYFERFSGEPDIKCMNMAGYHAVQVGNHDFDNGWPHLQKLLQQGSFRSLCANVFCQDGTKPILAPFTLLKIGQSNVAVIGVLGVDAWLSIKESCRKDLQLVEPKKVLDDLLPTLSRHTDLIILLSHCGIRDDRELAKHPLVDIIIGGHSHTLMRTTHETVESLQSNGLKKTPVIHTFRNGSLVGNMHVRLSKGAISVQTKIVPLDEQYDLPHESKALLDSYRAQLDQTLDLPLGRCIKPLSAEGKMQGLIPLGQAVAEVLRKACAADVFCINSGTIKSGFAEGVVAKKHIYSIFPHPDPLLKIAITGASLQALFIEGNKRWGKDRTFQYAGVTVDTNGQPILSNGCQVIAQNHYTLSAPAFFIQREQLLLGESDGEVTYPDMREPLIAGIKEKGLGEWILPEL